jgi:hypothetical protein
LTNDPENRTARQGTRRLPVALGAMLIVLFLPIVILGAICFCLLGLLLLIIIWCWWCPRGKRALFVHSNSPVWQDYVSENILGRISQRAILLNWSERNRWRVNLPVVAFWYFGGARQFNPLGVVFRPLRLPRLFRFYEPFREFKHGKTRAVEKMTNEFLDCL